MSYRHILLPGEGLLKPQLMERLSEALMNEDNGDDDNDANIEVETGERSDPPFTAARSNSSRPAHKFNQSVTNNHRNDNPRASRCHTYSGVAD